MSGSSSDPFDPAAPLPLVSPVPRRIIAPRWFDARLIVGVVLVLGSVLLGAVVVGSAGKTYGSVAATRYLAAGKVLTADDVTIAQVQLPDHGDGVYLSGLGDAVGKRLRRDVSAGELVPAAAVSTASAQTTLSIPLASAAAPDLRSGQRIEVWLTSAACASVVLLPDVTVQSVRSDSSGAFSAGGSGQDVVITVDAALADRVASALAIDGAQLRAGVLTSPDPPAAFDPGALPSISGCAAAK